jgi:hypothetical protein
MTTKRSVDENTGDLPPIRKVACAFYDRLRGEGFTHEQVLHLANDLLSLVREDIVATPAPASRRGDG